MYKLAKPFFIRVITPLHAGSGQDLGIVDLPIQRERHTGFPKIEASGLKGSIREVFGNYLIRKEEKKDDKIIITFDIDKSLEEKVKDNKLFEKLKKEWKVVSIPKKDYEPEKEIHYTKLHEAISLLFGPENTDNAHAGALGFTDARILLFPVKSAKGVFAWVTCPSILERLKEDYKLCVKTQEIKNSFDKIDIPSPNTISDIGKLLINGTVILEEYAFSVSGCEITKQIAEKISKSLKIEKIKERLIVLSDEDFRDFTELSTEVITRTKIDNETGTVDKKTGGLWTEEYLPPETIMYSFALATPIFNKDKGIFNERDKSEEEQVLQFWSKNMPEVMQIGGNATIGKGLVEIIKEDENENNQ